MPGVFKYQSWPSLVLNPSRRLGRRPHKLKRETSWRLGRFFQRRDLVAKSCDLVPIGEMSDVDVTSGIRMFVQRSDFVNYSCSCFSFFIAHCASHHIDPSSQWTTPSSRPLCFRWLRTTSSRKHQHTGSLRQGPIAHHPTVTEPFWELPFSMYANSIVLDDFGPDKKVDIHQWHHHDPDR